ncbi:MAG: hypothetical protein HY659_09350 [Rhizobiales bacterium]|nr:hypothetical protein [Hyphomicrobiales bacterium]
MSNSWTVNTMRLATVALFALAALGTTQANAGSAARSSSCVGSGFAVSCSTNWRWDESSPRTSLAPEDPKLTAEAAEREAKWVTRCKPVIRQDRYGVRRYHYAAPGCEFGKAED